MVTKPNERKRSLLNGLTNGMIIKPALKGRGVLFYGRKKTVQLVIHGINLDVAVDVRLWPN